MRLIIPLILIALMLPYATGEDAPTPSGEYDIEPMPHLVAAARRPDPDAQPATQPTTRPVYQSREGEAPPEPRSPRRQKQRLGGSLALP